MSTNNNNDSLDSLAEIKHIEQVREAFLQEYHANPELYHEADLKRVQENDLWVSRFINFLNQGAEKGLEHMIDTFRWRKNFGVNTFDPTVIPIEVYEMGAIFVYGVDYQGSPNLYIRVKMHRKIDFLEERIKSSLVNFIEAVDSRANKELHWNLILDMNGSGYSNVDLEMLLFLMPTLRRHYPNGVKNVFVTGLPWILNSVARFALALMPIETIKKVKFATSEELAEKFIPKNQLPDFLEGTNPDKFRVVPKGAKTCETLGRELYNLTSQDVEKLIKPSLKHIEEGRANSIYL